MTVAVRTNGQSGHSGRSFETATPTLLILKLIRFSGRVMAFTSCSEVDESGW